MRKNQRKLYGFQTTNRAKHIMLHYIRRVSISSIVNPIKSITTHRAWEKYSDYLYRHFWKEKTFWSDGYFVCSVGEASPETIRNYISNQG